MIPCEDFKLDATDIKILNLIKNTLYSNDPPALMLSKELNLKLGAVNKRLRKLLKYDMLYIKEYDYRGRRQLGLTPTGVFMTDKYKVTINK
jgi:DNA-binding Lrp family transcriptional regulator